MALPHFLQGTHQVQVAAACVVLALPWVSPFASGPSPSVQPWLLSLFIAGMVLAAGVVARLSPRALGRLVLGGAALGAAFNAVAGILQYSGLSDPLAPWVTATQIGQAFGNLRQRNQFATLMLMGQAVVLASGLRGARWGGVLPALALMSAGNAMSSSRTGALGLLMVGAIVLVWRGVRDRNAWTLLGWAGGVYLLVAVGAPSWLGIARGIEVPSLFDRFAEARGCGSRLLLWSNVLHLIAQKPWLGWGWGELDFAHYTTLYGGERFCDILDNAHNLPLQLAVELGVPVAVLACGAALWFVGARAPWREADPVRQAAWLVLAVILLHSLLEYPLWYGPFQLAFWACVAMLWRLRQHEPSPGGTVSSVSAVVGQAGAGLVLMVFALFAWWDYARVSQLYLPYEQRSPAYRDDTLAKVSRSWLFEDSLRFAELTTVPLSPGNATHVSDLARRLLHFSPEPRVVRLLIESLVMQGREDEAAAQLARMRAAFPQAYNDFVGGSAALPPAPAPQTSPR